MEGSRIVNLISKQCIWSRDTEELDQLLNSRSTHWTENESFWRDISAAERTDIVLQDCFRHGHCNQHHLGNYPFGSYTSFSSRHRAGRVQGIQWSRVRSNEQESKKTPSSPLSKMLALSTCRITPSRPLLRSSYSPVQSYLDSQAILADVAVAGFF